MTYDDELLFQVECKSTCPFFEPIAAFNHVKVAYRYAQDCLHANPRFAYRLRDLATGKLFPVNAYKSWESASKLGRAA